MVREAHGLEQLMGIVKDKNMRENKPLLAAATGALWKCTLVEENVKHLDNVSRFGVLYLLSFGKNDSSFFYLASHLEYFCATFE